MKKIYILIFFTFFILPLNINAEGFDNFTIGTQGDNSYCNFSATDETEYILLSIDSNPNGECTLQIYYDHIPNALYTLDYEVIFNGNFDDYLEYFKFGYGSDSMAPPNPSYLDIYDSQTRTTFETIESENGIQKMKIYLRNYEETDFNMTAKIYSLITDDNVIIYSGETNTPIEEETVDNTTFKQEFLLAIIGNIFFKGISLLLIFLFIFFWIVSYARLV